MTPDILRVFIGYDSREPAAYHVLAHSMLRRASLPVSITPLRQNTLRAMGLYTRERGPTESTEFSLTRFLVPTLCDYRGYALFLDCDMLVQTDLAELWPIIGQQMSWRPARAGDHWGPDGQIHRPKAVLCCPHDYVPKSETKMDGQVQTSYPRKNWSSCMLFDCGRCRHLSSDYVNRASGLELHRFHWVDTEAIGALPLEWNWLVGEYDSNPDAKILHWTLGGPWMAGYENVEHADRWWAEWAHLRGTCAIDPSTQALAAMIGENE